MNTQFNLQNIDNINEINTENSAIIINFIKNNTYLTESTKKNLIIWLDSSFKQVKENQQDAHQIILSLLKDKKWEELKDRFFEQITPGTAGLRGVLGVGSTRVNEATIGMFAQAHANYLAKMDINDRQGIIIAGDSRKGSYDPVTKGPGYLQKMAAEIYANANIPVYVSDKPLPTPVVSFVIGELPLKGKLPISAAINTASHNPASDNGFKIYEAGSHQVVSKDFKDQLSDEISQITSFKMVKRAKLSERWPETEDELTNKISSSGEYQIQTNRAPIFIIDSSYLIESYSSKIRQLRTFISKNLTSKENNEDKYLFCEDILNALKKEKIVITTLCGNGWAATKNLLQKHGLKENMHFFPVKEETEPNGEFPVGYGTIKGKPNPEYAENFYRGIQLAKKINAKYVFACDPDSDRIGIGMIDPEIDDPEILYKNTVFFSGNEQLSIAAAFLGATNKFTKNDVFIKTRVSSNLYSNIINLIDATLLHVLVGFKYFGQISNHYVLQLLQKENISRSEYSLLSHDQRKLLYKKHSIPQFIHGGEESMGQNMYDFVYDKDTPATIALFAEIIGFISLQKENKTQLFDQLNIDQFSQKNNAMKQLQEITIKSFNLKDFLNNLFISFGNFKEETFSFRFEGEKGNKIKNKVMQFFRNKTAKEWNTDQGINGFQIKAKMDYLKDCDLSLETTQDNIYTPPLSFSWITGEKKHTLDKADYIAFYLDNNDEIHIRPSGTEPIIKVYLNFSEKTSDSSESELQNTTKFIKSRMNDAYQEIKLIIDNLQQK